MMAQVSTFLKPSKALARKTGWNTIYSNSDTREGMGGQEHGGRGVFNNFQGKVFSCRTCQNNNDPGSTRRPPFFPKSSQSPWL